MGEYSDYSAEDMRREKMYERWLETRPRCDYCCEPIEEESAYWIDERWICESCIDDYLNEYHKERVPDEC